MPISGVNPVWMHANESLSESERRVWLMLDSAAEAICACDSTGTCQFANRSAARILGYGDPAELLGKNLHSLGHHTRKDGTPYPIEECPIYLGFLKGHLPQRIAGAGCGTFPRFSVFGGAAQEWFFAGRNLAPSAGH